MYKFSYNKKYKNKWMKNHCKNLKNHWKITVKIKERNTGKQNILICQITSMRKISAKPCKFFPNFCNVFIKQFVWVLDVDKCLQKLDVSKTK